MEDTIKLPLDADGVPIRPGDVVYFGQNELPPLPRNVIAITLEGTFAATWAIKVEREGYDPFYAQPSDLTHTKPDTLEDIEQALCKLAKGASCGCTTDQETMDVITSLMERIKRMVEE